MCSVDCWITGTTGSAAELMGSCLINLTVPSCFAVKVIPWILGRSAYFIFRLFSA